MHTVVDSVDRIWGEEVVEGLKRFAEPPDWLLALDDPEAVTEALVRCVPELAGEGGVRECEVLRVRLREGTWMGQYRVVVLDGDEEREVRLRASFHPDDAGAPAEGPSREAFGAEGWSCYAPELHLWFQTQPPDEGLASLPALTDPDRARALIQRGMRESSAEYADVRIETCAPHVMRYKPGSRCTVLYDLGYSGDGDGRNLPDPVVAKTHHGPKGANAHESMVALWNSPLRRSVNVTVAEPLGFLPDENVLLQGPIKEDRTLKQQLRASIEAGSPKALDELRFFLHKTGRGLADLHDCGVGAGSDWTFEDEMAEVRERTEKLAGFAPGLAGAAEPLLTRLESIAAAHPADRRVPSHRSFRPAQVLIHGRDIGFIDFDSFCQSEPALDLSLFCSTFRDLTLRALQERDGRPGPGEAADAVHVTLLDDLCGVFLEGYEHASSAPFAHERVDLWHALLTFDRIVTCWTKNRFERLPHCMSLLTHLYGKDELTKLVA